MSTTLKIVENTAIEKVKLWTRINKNKKEIKRLKIENKIMETDLAQLEQQPVNYFLMRQRMQAKVKESLKWAEGTTAAWRSKYNLNNLRHEFDKIKI